MIKMALQKLNNERRVSYEDWKFAEATEGEELNEDWTFETDIWSLGILLFEMVTQDIKLEESPREDPLTLDYCLSKIKAPYL